MEPLEADAPRPVGRCERRARRAVVGGPARVDHDEAVRERRLVALANEDAVAWLRRLQVSLDRQEPLVAEPVLEERLADLREAAASHVVPDFDSEEFRERTPRESVAVGRSPSERPLPESRLDLVRSEPERLTASRHDRPRHTGGDLLRLVARARPRLPGRVRMEDGSGRRHHLEPAIARFESSGGLVREVLDQEQLPTAIHYADRLAVVVAVLLCERCQRGREIPRNAVIGSAPVGNLAPHPLNLFEHRSVALVAGLSAAVNVLAPVYGHVAFE